MIKPILLALLLLFLVSCSPERPTTADAQTWVNEMAFVRHANGLCFGVIQFSTYGGRMGTSITQVSSEACSK